MKTTFSIVGGIVILLLLVITGGVFHAADWFINDPSTGVVAVVKQEANPKELLRKYTWFKETRAALDAKLADLKVYENKNAKFEKLEEQGRLDRTNREQLMTWQQEQAGIAASYNDLAAEYNAKHAEVQWRFTDVGNLPQGETEIMPRSYAPYITK